MRLLAVAVVLSLTAGARASAQERLSREQAVEDVRYFLRTLEQTHPDPYSAFGGKVAFKLRAQDLLAAVPAEGLTADALYSLMVPFLATLGDGHTSLRSPVRDDGRPARQLPVVFAVATDATFVAGATAEYEELVGDRLVAVEGLPLAEVERLASGLLPTENASGAARAATVAVTSARYVRRLLQRDVDTLRVLLREPHGTEIEQRIPFVSADAGRPTRPRRPWPALGADSGAIWWRYFDPDRVGYLRLSSIEAQEPFAGARGRQDLPQYVAAYYRRYMHREAPANIDRAIAGVPCFTESVAELLTMMRDKKGAYLVIDLRQDGGGWSSLGLPLYLLRYGNRYLDYAFPETWVDVASPQLLHQNGWTVSDLRTAWGDDVEVGDYRRSVAGTPRAGRTDDEYAKELEKFGCGLADWYRRLGGRPLDEPAVIVLVDTGTFSAAFAMAYDLWRLGALILGVAPAQAGNAFTNVVPLELPHSHLRGSIARSVQIYFPGDTVRGRTLRPDFPMTWDTYAHYGFDAESEVRYALDLIASGRIHVRGER
jgi:hypothetical protein